jgi:hypothetical protein
MTKQFKKKKALRSIVLAKKKMGTLKIYMPLIYSFQHASIHQ